MSADGPRRLTHLFAGVVPPKDWLTMAQLAVHGKFMARDGVNFSPEAARKFVQRHRGLHRSKRGAILLVDRATFDRFIEQAARIAS